MSPETILEKIDAQLAVCEKAICPRCKILSLVHDFAEGAWECDRCTRCGCMWFNDPPRLESEAPWLPTPREHQALRALKVAVEGLERSQGEVIVYKNIGDVLQEMGNRRYAAMHALLEIGRLMEGK